MEDRLKNKLGVFLFIFVIVSLIVSGYIFTNYITNDDINSSDKKEEAANIKTDDSKDYIYFENAETISDAAEIYYQDIVINIKGFEDLETNLNNEKDIFRNNIKYINDIEGLNQDIINYNNDNIYALTYRKYDVYEYDKYLTLLVTDYNYSCFDLMTFNANKSYIFNIENGKLLEDDEVLSNYNTNINSVKEKVRENLTNKQTTGESGANIINIDETLSDFKYSLFVNEYGRLNISYLVKTTETDYNDVMEV